MRVLFVCTGNTCRSPLAERLARARYPAHQFESAGVLPAGGMHPLSRQVLLEHHADPAGFTSRSAFDLDLSQFDRVIRIGETAQLLVTQIPASMSVHDWDVADPFEASGPPEHILAAYRACAQELIHCLEKLLGPARDDLSQDKL